MITVCYPSVVTTLYISQWFYDCNNIRRIMTLISTTSVVFSATSIEHFTQLSRDQFCCRRKTISRTFQAIGTCRTFSNFAPTILHCTLGGVTLWSTCRIGYGYYGNTLVNIFLCLYTSLRLSNAPQAIINIY